ncbi:MAG: hypothetical protein SFX73_28200 [Kofleriaceae bacterium]|nr:hypothetical protein [Kofleriaceae bacterium]
MSTRTPSEESPDTSPSADHIDAGASRPIAALDRLLALGRDVSEIAAFLARVGDRSALMAHLHRVRGNTFVAEVMRHVEDGPNDAHVADDQRAHPARGKAADPLLAHVLAEAHDTDGLRAAAAVSPEFDAAVCAAAAELAGLGWGEEQFPTAAGFEANPAHWRRDGPIGATPAFAVRSSASGAISDVFNASSKHLYKVDCYVVIDLVLHRAAQKLINDADRFDAKFNKTMKIKSQTMSYGGYTADGWDADLIAPETKKRQAPIDRQQEVLRQAIVSKMSDGKQLELGEQLQVGHHYCFLAKGHADVRFMKENVIYVGDGKFFAHPWGILSGEEIITRLSADIGDKSHAAGLTQKHGFANLVE